MPIIDSAIHHSERGKIVGDGMREGGWSRVSKRKRKKKWEEDWKRARKTEASKE